MYYINHRHINANTMQHIVITYIFVCWLAVEIIMLALGNFTVFK